MKKRLRKKQARKMGNIAMAMFALLYPDKFDAFLESKNIRLTSKDKTMIKKTMIRMWDKKLNKIGL